MFVRATRLALTGALVLTVSSGCGSDGPDADTAGQPDEPPSASAEARDEDSAASEPNGIVVDVTAVDNNFRPEDTEITAGTEIRWENRGRSGHNVLPVDESLDWGVEVDEFLPGDEYTLLFDTPGTYPYYCSLHGTTEFGMIGTIVVTG